MSRSIVVLLVVLLAAAPLVAAPSPAPPPDPTLKALAARTGAAFDVAFIQAIVPFDEETIEIALNATLNADHVDLLKWNQVVAERKSSHVRQLLALAQESGTPTRRLAGIATDPVKRVRALKGAQLERFYLPLMATRLERSAAWARLAATRAADPELRALARKIATTDAREAAMLRGWLKKWYGTP